ncbi:hypothetical protein APHAL10511_002541 [Amanita phalloides]|nr:hypothetical protein APHAL10511_002541 [Amanita phalloides]
MPKQVHNVKARQSTAGSRKKGKVKVKSNGANSSQLQTPADSNAEILIPKSKEQKYSEKKEKLRAELIAQSDAKWTNKKKKRLDKYIEKKLKKEERMVIFEKLVQTQAEIPSSLQLYSSATLWTGHAATHQALMDREEDKEARRGLNSRGGKRKRIDTQLDYDGSSENDDLDNILHDADAEGGNVLTSPQKQHEVTVMASNGPLPTVPIPLTTVAEVGSALKRNSDGTVVPPTVRPRNTKKSNFKGWKYESRNSPQPESEPDTSFESSDSAFDTENDSRSSQNEDYDGEETSEPDGEPIDFQKDGEDVAEDSASPSKRKAPGFKEWARKQLEAAKGYTTTVGASPDAESQHSKSPPAKKRKVIESKQEWRGPLGEDLKLPETTFAKSLLGNLASGRDPSNASKIDASPALHKAISINRLPDIEEARLMLPVVAEEQTIVEAILLNPVVIICGETGSGKTTQIPQFLYEAGFGSPGSDNPGMIGVTQPRRVAAMSMAARVAHELSLTSSHVSYQIRYDATVSPATSIKFMTDGVLLRELATDFLLSKYSAIVIDEAHERSMNTDVLIGVLSRVIKLREQMWKDGKDGAKPLRLIIMSATLRVGDFSENKALFAASPPVINISSRQHPVTIHFSRRTPSDYVTEAIMKTIKIHSRLPPGGILIFLTGQNEIMSVCRRLETKFGRKAIEERKRRRVAGPIRGWAKNVQAVDDDFNAESAQLAPTQVDIEAEDMDLGTTEPEDLAFDVDDGVGEEDSEALDSEEEQNLYDELGLHPEEEAEMPMHILPLYSILPSERQMRVFQTPPADCRLVVIATNVAETSLTIPGIRYVVDCGRAKERHYDVSSGIQAFTVNWISKASAAQRTGRAGRTGPGHCYRLYSSALYENHFTKFPEPEILRMPIEGVVLQMKAMHIDAVINFPFPTSPDRPTLQKAETVLTHLGALKTSLTTSAQITDLGRTMALFPLSPRFSRMLVSGQQHGCLPYVITIVSALSVGDPFLHEALLSEGEEASSDHDALEVSHVTSEAIRAKEARRVRRKAFFQSQSLHASLGKGTSDILKLLSVAGAYEYSGGGHEFCGDHFVRPKAMEEIHKLRAQINNIVQMNFPGLDTGFSPKLKPPNDLQIKILRQLIAAAFIDQVAVRKDKIDKTASTGTQCANSKGVPYKAMGIMDDVFIHPSSVLFGKPPPEYVVYHEVARTTRVWLKGVTVVNPSWLSSLGRPSLCTFSKLMKNEKGVMMCIPRFGPDAWELPLMKVET